MTRFMFCKEEAVRLEQDVTSVSIDQALLDLNMLTMEHSQRVVCHENACRMMGIYDTLSALNRGSPLEVRQARLTLESCMRYIPHSGVYTEDGRLHTESVSGIAMSIWNAICAAFQKLWDWICKTFRRVLNGSVDKNKTDTKGLEHALEKEKEKNKKEPGNKMSQERTITATAVSDALPHIGVINKEIILNIMNEAKTMAGFVKDYAVLLQEMADSARVAIVAIEDMSKYPGVRDSFYEAAAKTMNVLIQQHTAPITDAALKLPAVKHYVQQNDVKVVNTESTELRMPTHTSVAIWLQTTAIQKTAHPLFVQSMGGTHRRNMVLSAKMKDAERILDELKNLHEIFDEVNEQVNERLVEYCIKSQRLIEDAVTKRVKAQNPPAEALMAVQQIQNYITAHQLVVSQITSSINQVSSVVNAYLNATLG